MLNDLYGIYVSHKLHIEAVGLVFACLYLALAWRKENHAVLAYFSGMIGALAIDIFILKGERPWWGWVALNFFFWLMLYEKFFKKSTLSFIKRFSAWVLMFLGDDLFDAD